jgi:hypothetical protein
MSSTTGRADGLTVVKALDLALRAHRGEPPRVAMCPVCPDEVLVGTFKWSGSEFFCLGCQGHFGFVDPRPAAETPELLERSEQAKARFRELFVDPTTGQYR